jgi:hypothetical protein
MAHAASGEPRGGEDGAEEARGSPEEEIEAAATSISYMRLKKQKEKKNRLSLSYLQGLPEQRNILI